MVGLEGTSWRPHLWGRGWRLEGTGGGRGWAGSSSLRKGTLPSPSFSAAPHDRIFSGLLGIPLRSAPPDCERNCCVRMNWPFSLPSDFTPAPLGMVCGCWVLCLTSAPLFGLGPCLQPQLVPEFLPWANLVHSFSDLAEASSCAARPSSLLCLWKDDPKHLILGPADTTTARAEGLESRVCFGKQLLWMQWCVVNSSY